MAKNNQANNCSLPQGNVTICGYTFCLHNIYYDPQNGLNINLAGRLNPARTLHRFGQGPFCDFKIKDHLTEKGLYCFVVNGNVKYIGKVTGKSTFGKRFNSGYGHISPYNTYAAQPGHSGGRLTNCHVNSNVNREICQGSTILVGFLPMNNSTDVAISNLEKQLINCFNPDWNIQFKRS